VLKVVARLLTRLRADYSIDLAQYIASGHSTEATNYKAGLTFIACIIGGFAFLWGFMVLILKVKGPSVGCASGQTFDRTQVTINKGGSTDLESNPSADELRAHQSSEDLCNVPEQNSFDDVLSMHSSIPSVEMEEASVGADSAYTDATISPGPTAREQRTRATFFLFGLLTLVCIPLILVYAFIPLKETSNESTVSINAATKVVDQVQTSLEAISLATDASIYLADGFYSNVTNFCPYASSGESVTNLQVALSTLSNEYLSMQEEFAMSLGEIMEALKATDAALDTVDQYFTQTNNHLWVVPCFLMIVGAVSIVSVTGVYFAWKDDSSRSFQRTLSYGLLPCLVICSLCCWAMAITLGMAAAMASDGCLYGSLQTGSPGDLIEATVQQMGNSTILDYVQVYTGDCANEEATNPLTTVDDHIAAIVNMIWALASQLESTESSELIQQCGSDNIHGFLRETTDQAKLLTVISKTLKSSIEALSCSRVQPVYVEVVNESMCSEAASSVSLAFLFFMLMGISTMGMITLRASWTQQAHEENIFKEEEEAENMIVDEHEEYLAYISKYKHEWQEYRGFDSAIPCDLGPEFVVEDVASQCNDSSEDRTESSALHAEPLPVDGLESHDFDEAFDPYSISDTRSLSTEGDISFLSLRSHTMHLDSSLTIPAPLLGISMSADEAEEELLNEDTNLSRDVDTVGANTTFQSHVNGFSLQPGVDTSVPSCDNSVKPDRAFTQYCDDGLELVKHFGRESPEHGVAVSSQVAQEESASERLVKSRGRLSISCPTTSRQKRADLKKDAKDYNFTRSEHILLELDEIGRGSVVFQPPSLVVADLKIDPVTPTSAVTKMNEQSSPLTERQYSGFSHPSHTPLSNSRRRSPRRAYEDSARKRPLSPFSYTQV
jgi:hypothetical protein